MIRKRLFLAVLAVALGGASPGGAAPFLYVFSSSGAFAKVDREDGRIAALWSLAGTPGFADAARAVGAPFLASTAFDTAREELFVSVAEPAGAPAPAPRHYRVARVRFPDFKVGASTLLPGWLDSAPRLLLDERAGRLYVQWFAAVAPGAPGRYHVSVLGTETLAEVDRWTADVARDAPLPAWDGRFYLFGDTERQILGPDRTLRLAGHSLSAERVAPEADRGQLERAGPGALPLAVDSAAGRRLIAVASPSASVGRQIFFVRNASGVSGPSIETPRGLGRLTPDGRRLVVQEIDGPASRPRSEVRSTGRVLIYDADTGAERMDLRDERLAGPVETTGFACADPEGSILVWRGREGRLALVDTAKSTLSIPDIDMTLDAEARCAFATE